MALRRNVYKSEGPVDIPLSCCRQAGANGGFPALGEAGRCCSQTFLSEGDEGKRNASRHHAGCICGSHRAVRELKAAGAIPKRVRVRSCKYLNNGIEMVQSQMTNSAGCAERSYA